MKSLKVSTIEDLKNSGLSCAANPIEVMALLKKHFYLDHDLAAKDSDGENVILKLVPIIDEDGNGAPDMPISIQIKGELEDIHNGLFEFDGELSYSDIEDSFIVLCELINQEAETDWELSVSLEAIGSLECTLYDLIVGAFWHFTEWHGGQNSKGYQALSALGGIYKPNMANGPETDSSEAHVYDALNKMAEQANK